jgi:hypothetical protein
MLGKGWAGQNLALLEKNEESKCLSLMSLWRDGGPLAICPAAFAQYLQM